MRFELSFIYKLTVRLCGIWRVKIILEIVNRSQDMLCGILYHDVDVGTYICKLCYKYFGWFRIYINSTMIHLLSIYLVKMRIGYMAAAVLECVMDRLDRHFVFCLPARKESPQIPVLKIQFLSKSRPNFV